MIIGSFKGGQAVARLRVRGPSGNPFTLEAVVDTGFTDWLTLPGGFIDALGLPVRERIRFSLADGSEVLMPTYTCEVEWFGGWKMAVAARVESGPLVGMLMFAGDRLSIDAVEGGQVEVSAIGVL